MKSKIASILIFVLYVGGSNWGALLLRPRDEGAARDFLLCVARINILVRYLEELLLWWAIGRCGSHCPRELSKKWGQLRF